MYMFFVWYWMCHRIVYCISVHMYRTKKKQLLSVCHISLFQILQSYHHITERRKYVHEYERQKTFLEFFSKYIWWLSKGKFHLARSNKNHVESSEKKKNIKFSSKRFQQFSASFLIFLEYQNFQLLVCLKFLTTGFPVSQQVSIFFISHPNTITHHTGGLFKQELWLSGAVQFSA